MRFVLALCCLLSPNVIWANDAQMIITNVKNFRTLEGAVQEKPLLHPVYDLSFPAYDAAFAEEFGLQTQHVTELDTGLRFIELRMITEGAQTNCYYNVVLDKSVQLDFPQEDYVPSTALNVIPMLPVDFESPKKKQNNLVGLRGILSQTPNTTKWPYSQRYSNRAFLGNRGYVHNEKGSKISARLVSYIISRSEQYALLTMQVNCYFSAHVFNDGIPALWLAQSSLPYNTMLNVSSDNFVLLTIPDSIHSGATFYLNQFQQTQQELMEKVAGEYLKENPDCCRTSKILRPRLSIGTYD